MSQTINNALETKTNVVKDNPMNPQKSFCKHCGSQINSGSTFCPSCGKPQGNVPVQQPYQYTQQPYTAAAFQQPAMVGNTQINSTTTVIVERSRSNGLGTAGFVFALLSFFFCWAPFINFVLWFLGALFSFIGLFKRPRGLAITGFIMSFIGIIILVTFFGAIIGLAAK